MNPSFYYCIGICILFIILSRLHLKQQKLTIEPFYTFFIPEIVAPKDPFPRYVIDENARSLMRFYPQMPKATFWLWESPDGIANPWEWLRPFFQWVSSTVPLSALQIKRSSSVNEIMENITKSENQLAILPSWNVYHELTTKENRLTNNYVSGVMNLFSYSIFAIVPYQKIDDPYLQLSSNIFATGTKWSVGPKGGLSDFVAKRIKETWFVSPKNIGIVAGETGPEIINQTWDECFEAFKNKQINGMLWCDVYPFPLWQKAQGALPPKSFILIPIQLDRQEILKESVPLLQTDNFPLINFDVNYLPMRVGPRLYWPWNSDFTTIQFPAVWVANPKYPRNDIYTWIYTFINQKRWLEDKLLKQSQWNTQNAFYFNYNIPVHPGTQQLRINYGLDSQQESSECVLYAGSRRCPIKNPNKKLKEIPPAYQPQWLWPNIE